VARLSAVWSNLKGEKMARSYRTALGQNGAEEFVAHGPRFVQLLVQAIDPDITVSQVRTALQAYAKSTET
jgi:hypothetical protein